MDHWEVPVALKKRMTEVARELRRNATRSEAILWEALRGRKCEGRKFRRQQKIGPFVVDFFCAQEKLVVEVDGGVHESQRALDSERQDLIESLGLRFLRISASEVEENVESVLHKVREAICGCPRHPHPPAAELHPHPPGPLLPSEGEGGEE